MIRSEAELKAFFESGDKPSESQWHDLIETLYHRTGSGDGSGSPGQIYEHVQSSAAQIWTVQHNLGTYPIPEITDLARVAVDADYYHLDSNTLIVSNFAAFTGYVRCHA
jgi:hypothetical protein